MTIEFHCPHCDKLLRTADDKAGVRANCPGCGETVNVPQTADSPATLDDSFAAADPGDVHREGPPAMAQASPAAPALAPCPMCGEKIHPAAVRCRFCGEELHPGPSAATYRTPHRGVLILIFGILGWVVCFPFGIAAWVMANNDLREMTEGRMDETGRGLTTAGKILGIVQCCLFALAIVFYGVLAMVAIMFGTQF